MALSNFNVVLFFKRAPLPVVIPNPTFHPMIPVVAAALNQSLILIQASGDRRNLPPPPPNQMMMRLQVVLLS